MNLTLLICIRLNKNNDWDKIPGMIVCGTSGYLNTYINNRLVISSMTDVDADINIPEHSPDDYVVIDNPSIGKLNGLIVGNWNCKTRWTVVNDWAIIFPEDGKFDVIDEQGIVWVEIPRQLSIANKYGWDKVYMELSGLVIWQLRGYRYYRNIDEVIQESKKVFGY